MHGACLRTLLQRAQGHAVTLLVLRDRGAVFGALLPEALRMQGGTTYYGNGHVAVWSFAQGDELAVSQMGNPGYICICYEII
ncbi:hypothetical protein EON64_17645 [archaeon]|nr:MAG: hypothetical protein EON64_17645 [archaeon]